MQLNRECCKKKARGNRVDQHKKINELEEEVHRLKEELSKAHLSEKRFLDALRLSPMALCHHDSELKYSWLYNPHMGFVQDDVIGKTDWDILDQDLADRMGEIKRRVLQTGKGERVEMPTVSGDENSEYFDLVVEPLLDEESGAIVGLSCSGIDVTEDRRRREAYKASEENLRFIFNASPMPIVVTYLGDGRPLFFNKAADDVFHLRNWNSIGLSSKGLLESLDIQHIVDRSFAKGESVQDYKFQYNDERGNTRYMSVSATKIFYDGETAILSTFHDLTKEAEYQMHLEEAKEKAELASVAKSQFLASASHDLRQPLHAMGLLLSVLEQYISDEGGKKVLDRITSSLEAMNELFSGILDISKLDANVVPVNFTPVSVGDVFRTLEREFVPIAEEKGLEIRFIPSSAYVDTDATQFERMLRNLISNAIRYTDTGRILVGARKKGERLALYVIDTGVGIAKEDQKAIFQEFRQVGNPERDRRKGLGLGLAICERVANLLGTDIALHSRLGHGSNFSFDLRRLHVEMQKEKKDICPDCQSLEGRRVLFIEDEVDVQVATKYMLESWGCIPLEAGSIEEARAIFRDGTPPPDVIVADYRLRDQETGLQAILSIRTDLHKNIPAIVLSGDTGAELIQELERHGLKLLNKPLMPQTLRDSLSELICT